MAQLIQIIGTKTPQAVVKMLTALKKLPETYVVVVSAQSESHALPELLVIGPENALLLIKVWGVTEEQVKSLKQPSLFERLLNRNVPHLQPGQSETEALENFRKQIAAKGVSSSVATAIAIPLIPGKGSGVLRMGNIALLTKDDLEMGVLLNQVKKYAKSLDNASIDIIRAFHTPESVIPQELTTRRKIVRNAHASTIPMLLSYTQETVLKNDLHLPEEGQRHARDIDVRLINGVAGSGKSLIILYRAKLLRTLFPTRRVLVITFNRALIQDLAQRYQRLEGDLHVEWSTVHRWCGKHLKGVTKQARKEWVRKEKVSELRIVHFPDSYLSDDSLLQEIDWIKDQGIFARQEYLDADRKGRGIGFTRTMREKMYDLFEAYQSGMSNTEWDWSDIPRELYQRVTKGEIALPQYDEILIDEAQFFAPIWWNLLKQALAPNGRLFIVADPTQGFLKRHQTWKSVGLSVVGRSVILNRSYRTTRPIMELALRWYQSRISEVDEDIVEPVLDDMPDGEPPAFITTGTIHDQNLRLSDEIDKLLKQDIPPDHILIVTCSTPRTVSDYLTKRFPAISIKNPGDKDGNDSKSAIRVCALEGATGLEAPIVFIAGINTLISAEHNPLLKPEERAELVQENTRRLYMAITRAGQKVILMHVGTLSESFQLLQSGTSGTNLQTARVAESPTPYTH